METVCRIIVYISIVLICYAVVSNILLKLFGVKEIVLKRAFLFGLAIIFIQGIPFGIANYLGVMFIGSLLGLVGSYYYVQSVVKISPYKNVAIIFLLPIIAMISATFIFFILFDIAWYLIKNN